MGPPARPTPKQITMMTKMALAFTALCAVSSVAALDPIRRHLYMQTMAETWHDHLDQLLLKDLPMIMTHDSATGYLPGGFLHPINNWAKTQGAQGDASGRIGFSGQLDCGARAFDLRPLAKDNELIMHHGDISVSTPVETALREVIDWANKHTSEPVFVVLAHDSGPDARTKAKAVVAKLGLTYMDNCDRLGKMTVADAKAIFRNPGGQGTVIVMADNCVADHYDPSIECYKGSFPFSNKFSCTGKNAHEAFDAMWSSLDHVSANPQGAPFFMAQAHWQYSTTSVEWGVLKRSTLVETSRDSHMNHQIAQRIVANQWPKLNFVELDDVCEGGVEVLKALRMHHIPL